MAFPDALAMPVHRYYDRLALRRDYGQVRDHFSTRNPHPDRILQRSSYKAINEKGDILREQAQYWGQRGVHCHQFFETGGNTLNLKLCALLIKLLNENGRCDPDNYLDRYINYMTVPGKHRHTYLEE